MFLSHWIDYLARGRPQYLIVHITSRCNYRCSHCFVPPPAADIGAKHFVSLARQAGRLFWLDIGGGEPFLRDDLAEIVPAFSARVIQIPTNASMPEKTVSTLREIKSRTTASLCVSLSLDGLRETHDRIRGREGSWDAVWDTYERIRGLGGVAVKINTVLRGDNYTELRDLMKEVKGHAPDFHSVILLRGTPRDPSCALPPPDELARIIPEILKGCAGYTYGRNPLSAYLLRNYHRHLWDVSSRILREKRQVIPCLAGRAHLVVMADGSVSSCELLPAIGDITTHSLSDILALPAFRIQIASIRAKKCFCTHNCALLASVFFNPLSVARLFAPRRWGE